MGRSLPSQRQSSVNVTRTRYAGARSKRDATLLHFLRLKSLAFWTGIPSFRRLVLASI
jgi:hypothetical protein